MSYQAYVYRIMIASPNDVIPERNIASEVVHSWNILNSEKNNIVLLPIGWETHSSPLMGNRPQEIINEQVTDKSDLLIGIFWTRIGTKTGDFESGTIEEIEKHIKNGKPTMLYFSDTPVRPDSIDNKQYEKLQQFKKSCMSKGLVETFDSINNFREKLSKQISLTINNNPYFENSHPIETSIQEKINPYERIFNELPEEATNLLIDFAVTEKPIFFMKFIGSGFVINASEMIEGKGQRELSKWESIFDTLILFDLIKDNSYKKESFSLTNKGFEYVEYLKGLTIPNQN